MIPSFSRLPLHAVVLTAAVVLAGCSAEEGGGGAGSTDAATVNGEQITRTELQQSVPLFEFLASLSQAPCGQPDPASGESADAACARFALGNMIQEEILQQYAQANDVTVPAGEVSSTIQQLEEQLGGAGELDALLKENDVTRSELEAFAQRLLLFQEVQKTVGETATTDAELRQAYEQNKLQYTELDTWQILVKTQQEADEIERQVTAKNFQDLADKYSIDPSVKQNHGDLGTMAASGLVEPYVRAALALQPGQISEPVQSEFGWHIIRLISTDVAPFDQVRDQLVQQSAGQSFQTWFQDRLEGADITVNPRYGRFDAATGQVTPIRSTASGSEPPSPPAGQAGAQQGSGQAATPTP